MIVVVVLEEIARRVEPEIRVGLARVVLGDGGGRDGEYAVGSEVGEHGGCQRSGEYGAPVIIWERVHLRVLI